MDRPLKEGQDRNLAKLIIGLKLLIKVLINFIKLQCEEQHFGSNENDCTTCNFSTLTVHYSDEQQVEPAAVCSKCTMLAEIIRSKHVKSNPNWSNYATAANRQWQLMKCYIEDYGYSETANVEKAGLKALVQICTNHVDVKRAIGNGLSYLLTILHIHDRVIHTKDTHVSDELLHECLTNIEEALKNIDDPQRNQYLEEIKTLMNDTKHITVQDDMKRCIWVLKTINRYITTLEHSSSCSTPVKTLKEIKISQYKHMHKICPDIIKDINKRRDKVERYMFVAEHLFNDTRPEYLCPAEPNNKKRNEELNHWYTHTMLGSISDFVIDINEKMGRISKDVQDRESIIMPRRQNPNDNETEQGELSHQRVNTGNDSHNNEELRDHQMSPQPEFQLPYQENEPDFFNCKRLVVAAIDIGTTYSCYAYSFSDEFQRDRLQIYLNNHWTDGNQMHTCRAPTVALFDKNESLHSFGYDAESTYNNLVETNEHIEWKYFRYFKMHLFSNKKVIQKDIHDSHGKPMPAIKLFASVISFFKVHLLTRLQQRDIGFKDTDIDWVLTVPTIWNDAARRFMLMAAKEAGIPENRISFAYETEAAAIYCKESFTTTARQQDREAGRFPFRTGDKFMVIDLGGGTVDMTTHEVTDDETLDSLDTPSGGPWGGTLVDKHFHSLMANIFDNDVYTRFSNSFTCDKLDFDRTLEFQKRLFKPTEKFVLKLPDKILDCYKDIKNIPFEEALQAGRYQGNVCMKKGSLIVNGYLIEGIFNESKDRILEHVDMLLHKPENNGVNKLLLVGGFAESVIMQEALLSKFTSDYEVMITQQPDLAVVRGAVIYGHMLQYVCPRTSSYSYGISTSGRYDEDSPPIHKCSSLQEDKCEDVFKVLVRKGENLVCGQWSPEYRFRAPNCGENQVTMEIYRSDRDPPPLYVSECECLYELVLQLNNVDTTFKAEIGVQMSFSGRNVLVEAKELGNQNNMMTANIDWLK